MARKEKNTVRSGSTRVLVFKERGIWYGVALELNIVESGDDPREVLLLLHEAIRGYLRSSRKARLDMSVVNQKADPEYERLWRSVTATTGRRTSVRSPYQIYSSSRVNLALV